MTLGPTGNITLGDDNTNDAIILKNIDGQTYLSARGVTIANNNVSWAHIMDVGSNLWQIPAPTQYQGIYRLKCQVVNGALVFSWVRDGDA